MHWERGSEWTGKTLANVLGKRLPVNFFVFENTNSGEF